MRTIGVFDAKSHLFELIDAGEPVTITKHGRPVALLSPIRQEAAAVAARIRNSPCVRATPDEIAGFVREGRR